MTTLVSGTKSKFLPFVSREATATVPMLAAISPSLRMLKLAVTGCPTTGLAGLNVILLLNNGLSFTIIVPLLATDSLLALGYDEFQTPYLQFARE